ncbi:hypothetical protein Acel_1668 [Acidothermus cellulolyticus 11B]|uniref:Secreted protein n=2 Tax=Acidothermus cellulolyticus TaxID=28049 RepID=A0LVI0_ACIC1|nr:hypothetical protein Acel_1668 [Acidothermus cellulolyticus 11B]
MAAVGGLLAGAPIASAATSKTSSAATASRGMAVAEQVFASSNPRAEYDKLNASDKASFDAVETPSSVTHTVVIRGLGANAGKTVDSLAAASSGSWWVSASWDEKALAGNTLFSYGQETKVYVSGGRVTSVQVLNMYSETSTPGWYQNGPNRSYTNNVGWEGRGIIQVDYALGVNGWNIQHVTPCGQLRLNANGYNYAVSSSCNPN